MANPLQQGTDRAAIFLGATSTDGGTQVSDANPFPVNVFSMPTVTVEATDLDIRDLTSVSDSIAAVQSGIWNITTLGTITNTVNVELESYNTDFLTNPLPVQLRDSSGNVLKILRKDESFNGTGGTGSNPTKTFTLLESSDVEIKSVFHQGNRLDFTSMWTRNNTNKTITMVDFTVENDETVTIEFDI